MFMVGFDLDTRSYLTFPTPIIAIPTGIKLLNRLATMWSSRFSLITPLYFIIGFLSSSSFGGFTGLISANSLIDTILHDPYLIIGHLHHVLPLGAIHTISAAFYTYWLFFTSLSFSDYLGRIHYGSSFISPNSISFSMHSLGIIGFPRRIYDYGLIYFKSFWFNSLGSIGIYLSLIWFTVAGSLVVYIYLFKVLFL